MKISGLHNQYTVNDAGKTDKKPATVAEYSKSYTEIPLLKTRYECRCCGYERIAEKSNE